MDAIFMGALYGGVAGVVYATAGFMSKNPTVADIKNNFDLKHYMETVLLAAFVGAGSAYTGLSQEAFTQMPVVGFTTILIQKFVKFLYGLKK